MGRVKIPTSDMNNTSARVIIFRSIGVCFFALVIWFAYTRFSPYLKGPLMIENSLEHIYETSTSNLIMEGRGKRVNTLSINGRETTLNDDGSFREMVVLLPGDNIIEVVIYDHFGKHRSFAYRIYGNFTDEEHVFDYEAVQRNYEIDIHEAFEDNTDDTHITNE